MFDEVRTTEPDDETCAPPVIGVRGKLLASYCPSTKTNAAPSAISTPMTINGVNRCGFDPVGMMLKARYSQRSRSPGAISLPLNDP